MNAVIKCILPLLLLTLAGCEKTVEDVSNWEARGKTKNLIKALDDSDMDVRRAAAAALKNLKPESAVEPLATTFSSSDAMLVLTAVEALAAIGNDPAVTHLITAMNHEGRKASIAAINGLGQLKASQAIEPLCEALNDIDDPISSAAAIALGRIGDPKAIQPLLTKMKDRSQILRLASINSLIQIGGPDTTAALALAMDDLSEDIRQIATDALIIIGKPAIPYALNNLRAEDALARQSAITILKGIGLIPTSDNDLVWYLSAQIPTEKKSTIDEAMVRKLTEVGDGAIEALFEAAAHPAINIREHAFLALENLGEPAAGQAVLSAEAHAGAAGKKWFNQRASWNGAPSWRIDLWAAATALNPNFKLNQGKAADLKLKSNAARLVMNSSAFKATREYIPLLIIQLDYRAPQSEHPEDVDARTTIVRESTHDPHLQIAINRLAEAGELALLPLIAALDSNDPQVADCCAIILGKINAPQIVVPLTEKLTEKIAGGEELSNSPFYTVLQEIDAPTSRPLLLKVRPNAAQAIRLFEQTYSDSRVTHTKSHNAKGDYAQPVAFTLGYAKGGKTGEMRIIFKKDGAGDWVPIPPLPDQLP